jgi:hypothetical protein
MRTFKRGELNLKIQNKLVVQEGAEDKTNSRLINKSKIKAVKKKLNINIDNDTQSMIEDPSIAQHNQTSSLVEPSKARNDF